MHFTRHINNWNAFRAEQIKSSRQQAQELAKILEQQEGIKASENYLQHLQEIEEKEEVFSTEFFEAQIAILRELNQYNP